MDDRWTQLILGLRLCVRGPTSSVALICEHLEPLGLDGPYTDHCKIRIGSSGGVESRGIDRVTITVNSICVAPWLESLSR